MFGDTRYYFTTVTDRTDPSTLIVILRKPQFNLRPRFFFLTVDKDGRLGNKVKSVDLRGSEANVDYMKISRIRDSDEFESPEVAAFSWKLSDTDNEQTLDQISIEGDDLMDMVPMSEENVIRFDIGHRSSYQVLHEATALVLQRIPISVSEKEFHPLPVS